MNLNCKPGDLAVVVRATNAENLGKVVRCLALEVGKLDAGFDWSDGIRAVLEPAAWWLIDSALLCRRHGDRAQVAHIRYAPDDCLRPLRDNDEDDETLTWAGKPNSVEANLFRMGFTPDVVRHVMKEK